MGNVTPSGLRNDMHHYRETGYLLEGHGLVGQPGTLEGQSGVWKARVWSANQGLWRASQGSGREIVCDATGAVN